MPVDSGALIKPAVSEAGIDAQNNIVTRSIREKIGELELKWDVAIVVSAHKTAIDKDQRVPEDSVELDPGAAACVAGRNLEFAPIPAHAGFRIAPAQRFVSVRAQLAVSGSCIVVHKRKFHGPVMGKFEQPPFGVVKRGLGKLKVTGLGEVALTKTEP